MEKILNYINGELTEPRSGRWLDNYRPATGTVFSQVPDSGEDDIALAIESARAALPGWAAMPVAQRSAWLQRIADAITANTEALAADEATDNGKTLKQALEVEIPRAAQNFSFFAHAITQFSQESHSGDPSVLNYTIRQPIGVVACISPWNLPLYLFSWKIAPALAAGNTVVAKPSEVTPLTAYRLAQLCREAGLPPGVLNIVHGSGQATGKALISHPAVKAISFTGSTRTGAHIASVAAPKFKKLSLELGGKNPALVFDDCDYERTVKGVVRAAFTNQGEICLCSSRIFVQRGIYERFRRDFVEQVARLRVGDPFDPDTDVGAIVSQQHYDKVLSYLALAREEGGTVLCGGEALQLASAQGGWYIRPTVIENLSNQCRTNQEEIFGPVVTLIPFDTEAEGIAMANDVEYGLSATVWTTRLDRAHRVAARLEAGVIWINTWLLRDLRTPFGGMKNSGVGREGGLEALRFFTEAKNVCLKL